jgi:hypothetical protein
VERCVQSEIKRTLNYKSQKMNLMKKLLIVFIINLAINGLQVLSQDAPSRRNSLLSKRPNSFQKSTTTTTAEPVEYEDEYGDEEENYEEVQETTTTTTEAPKKRPIVRPFRSNEDLLAALKKRRLNEKNKPVSANTKPVQEEKLKQETVTKPPTVKTTAASSSINKRRFGGSKSNYAKPIIQEQQAQTIEEPVQRTSSFRRPSRFASRN